jgi:hypothetical protein
MLLGLLAALCPESSASATYSKKTPRILLSSLKIWPRRVLRDALSEKQVDAVVEFSTGALIGVAVQSVGKSFARATLLVRR